MKIFNTRHFLRHVSMPTLREFTDAHVLAPFLTVDWNTPSDQLPEVLSDIVDTLSDSLQSTDDSIERENLLRRLNLWHDDLKRIHLLSNELAANEFHLACANDKEVQVAFENRDVREKALWMFAFRGQVFRDVELRLAFQAKANGKYWKKHRIAPGLEISGERDKLEAFSTAVASLFAKVGGGKSTHIECSHHAADQSTQLTTYVEGPVTALAHFADKRFKRTATRIALETALVYQRVSGVIESVVKGGGKNHLSVLELFGKHILNCEIKPEEVAKPRFNLNGLRNGLEMFDDLSPFGVEKVRVRRAQFRPCNTTGISMRIEASAEKEHPDAIDLGRARLKVEHSFDAEYDLDGASILVYMWPIDAQKGKHFSFDVYATGSSTIKNLPQKNQSIANAVLKSLNVIDRNEATP